jgi:hypothetical protein
MQKVAKGLCKKLHMHKVAKGLQKVADPHGKNPLGWKKPTPWKKPVR